MEETILLLEGAEPQLTNENFDFDDAMDFDAGKKTRYCVEVKRGSSGLCKCAKFEWGKRMPHEPDFKELCAIAGINNNGGGNIMARKKKGFSLGQDVAETLGLDMDQLKQSLMTGAAAAGGAWASKQLANWMATVGKTAGEKPRFAGTTKDIVTVGIGFVAAGLVGKFTDRKDIAYALAAGPIAVTVLKLMGEIAGEREALGMITAEKVPYFEPRSQPPVQRFPTASNLVTERLSESRGTAASVSAPSVQNTPIAGAPAAGSTSLV